MDNFLSFYQHIPFYLNPTAFQLGFLRIDWYSLMYLAAFATVYILLRYRIKKGEFNLDRHPRESGDPVPNHSVSTLDSRFRGNDKKKELVFDFLSVVFAGLLIGARLGYVFFYNFSFYLNNPLAIISPFDAAGNFIGLYGMSYHGGLLGAIVAGLIFAKIKKISFWRLAEFIIPAIPAGYFFGRLGNFLNGELYGRATDKFWGMYFPTDPAGLLRHPSQLYEAAGEGLILFIILWSLRNKGKFRNRMLGIYLAGYAFWRILIEFFRQPDESIGYIFNFLTLGQMLSLIMLIGGLFLIFHKNKRVV